MPSSYDAIVVGARCAGSSTAMLLARAGHRVLLLDRASFPSDTMSTHLVHPPGVAALERWGLLDQLVASGCPPIGSYRIDFGPFAFAAPPRPAGTIATAYAPRRTVLDKLLVDAAVAAGGELREGCTVEEVLVEDGTVTGVRVRSGDGATATERAAVVVGADGLHSTVARAVQARRYHEQPALEASYYTYWSGLETTGFEGYIRPQRSWAAFPTHEGLTVVIVGWPRREFEANRGDVEGNYLRMFELTCQLASMAPPPPELQALLGALPGNPEAAAGFVSVIAGTLPAPEFFAPDNVQRIMAAAAPGEG
jgi:2-polyprenyl-6-methoxyphenol hydroxylase-like FAD-dependent oxidoreductase